VFLWTARGKGDVALIDLRLFRGEVFSTAAVVQFLANGVVFAGQMLMPIYLIQACGRSPGEVGLLLAPLGIGMLCTYPAMGNLTDRFGTRRVSAGGALLSLLGVLPLVYLASHAFDLVAFGVALFIRGLGQSAIGLPSISAAYASVRREDLPMATTSLNIVQRLGGPTWTTLCAIFLQWRLSSSISDSALLGPFSAAFLFLGALQALLLMAALRLPSR
jgi:MFS family permease